MSKTYEIDVSVVCAVLVDFVVPRVDVVQRVVEADHVFTVVAASESPLKKYNLFIIILKKIVKYFCLKLTKKVRSP